MRGSRVLLLTLALLVLSTSSALADGRVPDIPQRRLPVAGTCGPLPTSNVTWVIVGEPGWYRIAGEARDIQKDELSNRLKAKAEAAGAQGQRHDVWIVVDRDQWWAHVVNVLHACQFVGLHRVGLQVQCEATGQALGFPLFLPYHTGAPGNAGAIATARRLNVRLEATKEESSYAPRLYAAAHQAVDRFGPIVAEVSVSAKTKVQDAVTAVDLLYRAGCAGVTLKYRMMIRSRSGPSIPQIWIQERLLPGEAIPVDVPAVAPRSTPWPDDGAAQPGAFTFRLEEIQEGGPETPAAVETLKRPLPNYAATRAEVPDDNRREAAIAVQQWGDTLGSWLATVLQPGRVSFPEPLLAKRRRQGLGAEEFFRLAREAYPTAERVRPATLRAQGFLFEGTRVSGKFDVTLSLSDGPPDVVFANWVVEEANENVVLPPAETEPYAAGTPGQLRVTLEGLLAAARARGPEAVPLASEAEVLAQLPAVAHAGARQAIARRGQGIEYLAGWLRARPFDRLVIVKVDGQAAVHGQGRVLGVLRYDVEGEGGELALASLVPKVANR